jgi:nucleoside-diphosphate-sugar epimerase
MGDSRPIVPRSPVILWTLAATNLMRLVPVTPGAAMDIIPVDYAAEAIARLLFAKRNHSVYHISAGESSYTTPRKITAPIEDYFPDRPPFKFVDKSFIEPMKKWAKKKHPVPEQLAP